MVVGQQGDKKRDFDFLSSVEVVMMMSAHAMLMQNWEHVEVVMDALNHVPKKQPKKCDFSRVRPWALEGLYKHFRQLIVVSDIPSPELNALYSRHMHSYRGRLKFHREVAGVLPHVIHQVKQVFKRIPGCTLENVDDQRFDFFCSKVHDPSKYVRQHHFPCQLSSSSIRLYIKVDEPCA
jgi:U3 small nucleolar RNA-associated protein 25